MVEVIDLQVILAVREMTAEVVLEEAVKAEVKVKEEDRM